MLCEIVFLPVSKWYLVTEVGLHTTGDPWTSSCVVASGVQHTHTSKRVVVVAVTLAPFYGVTIVKQDGQEAVTK